MIKLRDWQEVHGINGADFGTSELICPFNIIINGFHFPYPLNGSNKPGQYGKRGCIYRNYAISRKCTRA